MTERQEIILLRSITVAAADYLILREDETWEPGAADLLAAGLDTLESLEPGIIDHWRKQLEAEEALDD